MTEEEIIEKAKKDSHAFDEIYRLYRQKLYYYILQYVKNKENAEDLTSVTFEKALKGITSFQWEGISLQSWLYKIARNTINDFYRKSYNKNPNISMDHIISSQDDQKRTIEDIIHSEEESIEIQIIKSEEEEKLYTILQLFEDVDQYLLYYKYFENMTNKQIAKIMDISESNVGTRLQRIRIKIKKFITL